MNQNVPDPVKPGDHIKAQVRTLGERYPDVFNFLVELKEDLALVFIKLIYRSPIRSRCLLLREAVFGRSDLTLRELAKKLNLSPAGANKRLKILDDALMQLGFPSLRKKNSDAFRQACVERQRRIWARKKMRIGAPPPGKHADPQSSRGVNQ